MRCLTSAKFSMLVDIIKPVGAPETPGGHYEWVQNPDSGAFEEVWIEDPTIPGDSNGRIIAAVPCVAKSAIGSSIRAAEEFGTAYLNEEWVKITLSFRADITQRDKVKNIRTLRGQTIWSEEESDGNTPTIFDVFKIAPVVDGFGMPVEKVVLVKRAEVQ